MCFDYKDWRNTLTDIISGCKYSHLVHYNTLLLLFCSSKLFNSKGGSHSTPLYRLNKNLRSTIHKHDENYTKNSSGR